MVKSPASQKGLTLVELLVGLAVGAIIVVAALLAWGLSVGTANYTLETSRLNHDLRSTMQIITQDLRRADSGSVSFSADSSCVAFLVSPRPSKVVSGACSAAVDEDGNPIAGTVTDPECWPVRGFRMNNSELQMYVSPYETTAPTLPLTICAGNTNWHSLYGDLNPGSFVVTDFEAACSSRCLELENYALEAPGDCSKFPRCKDVYFSWVEILSVGLTLGGEVSVGGNTKRIELTDTISVRNSDFFLE